MVDYKIKDIYQGGTSAFEDSYGDNFTGFRIKHGEMGAPTKPDTANQLQQVNTLLNQGMVPIEFGALFPGFQTFDQIPKQHFKESKRLAKLNDAKLTMHAPIEDPSGFGEQGWSEDARELTERQLKDMIHKAVDLSDDGGIPITIHSSNAGGSEYIKDKDGNKIIGKLAVIDRESGRPTPIEGSHHYMPGMTPEQLANARKTDPMDELNSLNSTTWTNNLFAVETNRESADRIMKDVHPTVINKFLQFRLSEGREAAPTTAQENAEFQKLSTAYDFVNQAQISANSAFNKAYKYAKEDGDQKMIDDLHAISAKYSELTGRAKDYEKMSDEEKMKAAATQRNPQANSQAVRFLTESLSEMNPKLYMSVEEFALGKASETFANVALEAAKYGDKAPKVSIENLYPGMAFSMKKEGEDGLPGMKELILKSKEKFVEKAKEQGMSASVAKKRADQIIGMTLDVGHLNIAKKHGFTDEDLVAEVKEIAPYVKHVHLTDNFGYSDSHLPPGMGNVPFKEHLKELEKAGVLKDTLKIVEAGGWVKNFGTSPLPETLQGMGSAIYASGDGPYWNQSLGLQQDYFGGYGNFLPQTNFSLYGAGFSQLPGEVGGVVGGGSRMSGRPME